MAVRICEACDLPMGDDDPGCDSGSGLICRHCLEEAEMTQMPLAPVDESQDYWQPVHPFHGVGDVAEPV